MGNLLRDLRFAVRMLMKKPGFAAVAVISLTLGIGANTTIFTLAKAVFLQTVPVKDPGRAVIIFSTQASRDGSEQQFLPSSYLNARDYREKNDVFSALSIVMFSGVNLDISGKPNPVFVELVNSEFFDILGVRLALGRGFLPEEDTVPGAHPVAILSNALWKNKFGGDPQLVGKVIRLNDQDFTVVGIAPPDFHDVGTLDSPGVWVPTMMYDQILTGVTKGWVNRRAFRMVFMVARLKPGVTPAAAQASIRALATQLQHEYPQENSGRSVTLLPIDQTNIPPQQRSLFVLAGALMMVIVGLVLLIACANVANLLLSRATQRQREIAIRLSLGATRGRLIRQLLCESLLLALIAGALGIACAYWARGGLFWLLPPNSVPQNLDFTLDARVLLYTLGLSVLATLLFGLAPALQASKPDSITALRDRTDSPSGSSRWYGLRGVLVMTQVSLSLIALVGSGLFIHSLRNARQIDPGFDVKHELTMFLNLTAQRYAQPRAEQFYRDVLERVRAIPAVADASLTDTPPMNQNLSFTTFPEGVDTSDPRNGKLTPLFVIAPRFFSTEGIGLLEGREFDDHDDMQSKRVVIVNQAMAERTWPGQGAIGKRVQFIGDMNFYEVVGVVRTVKYQSLGEPPQAILYLPLKQRYMGQVSLIVRAAGDPNAITASVRSTVLSLDPTLQLTRVVTVSEILDQSLVAPRVGAELLGTFGMLALLLAAIGTYGVMSYSVSQRTREIGIRMALGAETSSVLRLILGTGMTMVLVGVAAGLVFATLLTRSMSSLLFGIGSFDVPSFLLTSLLLLAVALLACWIPAYRATRIDPMIALRYE